MAESMQSEDVRDFVADLRRQTPPDMAAKLLNQAAPEKTYALAETAPRPVAETIARGPQAAAPPAKRTVAPPDEEFTSPASYWLSLMLLTLGLALAGGLVFVTFAWPLLE